jgi:hypothetical protein
MTKSCSLLPTEGAKTQKNYNFYVILNEYETLLPTLREEHKLRMLERMLLGRICEYKRKAEIGNWRRLNNEKLHMLSTSLRVLRMIAFEGLVERLYRP